MLARCPSICVTSARSWSSPRRATSAARPRRLFITQPALSRQMQQLERCVGGDALLRAAHGRRADRGRPGAARQGARARSTRSTAALAVGHRDEPRGRLALGLPIAGRRDQWYGAARRVHRALPRGRGRGPPGADRAACSARCVAGELDAASGCADRRPGLEYTRSCDRAAVASGCIATHDPLAGPRGDQAVRFARPTRSPWSAARPAPRRASTPRSGASSRVPASEPEFVRRVSFPAHAVRDPGVPGIASTVDFPDDVVGVPLVPDHRWRTSSCDARTSDRSAVRAFAPVRARGLRAAQSHARAS